MAPPKTDPIVRFNKKWFPEDRGYETLCHIWTASKYSNGYGQFDHQLAHRWILRYVTGATVKTWESYLQANHLCNQRDCVNPSHLYAGTQMQNVMDEMLAHNHPLRGHNYCWTCGLELVYLRGQRRCPDSDRREHRRLAKARGTEAMS